MSGFISLLLITSVITIISRNFKCIDFDSHEDCWLKCYDDDDILCICDEKAEDLSVSYRYSSYKHIPCLFLYYTNSILINIH